MNKRLKTTGELRQFLCDSILAVTSGDMKPETAARVTKLAAQVNESFYSEIKVQRTMREAGNAIAELGTLKIAHEG